MIERYSQKRSQSLEDEDTSTYFKANLYQLSTAQCYVLFGLCISWRLNVRFHGGRRSHQNSSHIPFSFNNSTSSSLRNSHKGASVFFFSPFLEATQVDPLTSVGADIGAYYRPEKNSRRVAQASLVLVSVNKQHQESLRVGYFTVRFILFPHQFESTSAVYWLYTHIRSTMAFVNNTSTLSWLPPNSTITSTSSISTNYPWDAGPWRSYFPEPFQSTTPYLDASQAIALSSFISYGREEACTSAYSAFEATVPWTTIFDTYPLPTSSTLPNGQITEFSYDYTLSYTEKLGGGGDFCCWACS